MINNYKFHINGMHCKNCTIYIEDVFKKDEHIKSVKVSLKSNSVDLTGDFGDMSDSEIADYLSEKTKSRNYIISNIKAVAPIKYKEYFSSIIIAVLFIIGFIFLQKAGIINLANNTSGYKTAFLIGIIASVSTCMATVGGLLLSISANYSKEEKTLTPHILFHASRIVSFFILGGVVGFLGSMFKIGILGNFIMSLVVGGVMIILGLNLLELHFAKSFQISMPKIFARKVGTLSEANNIITPIIIGALTFILPCGFTQAMQVYALSSGSFISGSLIMLFFALGTLPVLALISFGSYSLGDNKYKGIFFKAAGFIVIAFAVFNLLNALASMGIINPIFSL